MKFIFFVFTLLLLNVKAYQCFGVDSFSLNVCSGQGACYGIDKCNCNSGYAGAKCEQKASTSCVWNLNSQTQTNYYPIIEASTLDFQNNNLIINILAPLVQGRLNTTIYIEDPTNLDCKYPGNFATNTLSETLPCNNVYGFVLPWNRGQRCGWSMQTQDGYITYTAKIFIEELENIGTLRGTPIQRIIKRIIPVSVKFQTSIELSTTVKVYAPVNLYAAVVKQVYKPQSTVVTCK